VIVFRMATISFVKLVNAWPEGSNLVRRTSSALIASFNALISFVTELLVNHVESAKCRSAVLREFSNTNQGPDTYDKTRKETNDTKQIHRSF
jgi:hypothetical protein